MAALDESKNVSKHGECVCLLKEVKVPLTVCHRNVHLFIGQYVTLTCRPNGSLRLNFKNLKIDTDFSVETYCLEVANEIRMALKGLIEN